MLPVQSGRIMHPEKELQHLLVSEFCRIKNNFYCLRMPGRPRANFFIGWVFGFAPSIADRGFNHSGYLANDFLHSPKTNSREGRCLTFFTHAQLYISPKLLPK